MHDNRQKVLNLLGLARRANKLVTGQDLVLAAIRKQKVALVFLAHDGGAGSQKKFTDKAHFYQIPLVTDFTRDELTNATGMARSVIGVSDQGFAKQMKAYLRKQEDDT